MKKINKLLTALVPLGTITLASISLVACKKPQEAAHISVTGSKEKTSELNKTTCTFELALKEELKSGESLSITITPKSTSQTGVNIVLAGNPVIDAKKVTFTTNLSYTSNNQTECWAKFDIDVKCLSSTSVEVWTQKITDFKHTSNLDTEKHEIVSDSKVNGVSIVVSPTTINETTPVEVKITNNWDEEITDGKLNVSVGDKYVLVDFTDSKLAKGENTISFTKKQIQELFTKAGKGKISDNDQIKFSVVRPNTYSVKEFKTNEEGKAPIYYLYQYDDFGKLSEDPLSYELIPFGFLIKNSFNEFVKSADNFPTFISKINKSEYNLFFLKGELFSEGIGSPIATKLNIYGINDTENNKISGLKGFKNEETGDSGLSVNNITFNLCNLNVRGRQGLSNGNDLLQGMFTQGEFTCNYCDFKGAWTLQYGHGTFNHCTFDSKNIYKMYKESEKQLKTMYPMYVYSGATTDFNDCTFNSIGKAIKIFSAGDLGKESQSSIKNCTFNLFTFDPEDTTYKEFTIAEFESPINIDARNQITSIYNITITSSTANEYWKQNKSSVTDDHLYWAISYAKDGGQIARNIKINNQEINTDEIPS